MTEERRQFWSSLNEAAENAARGQRVVIGVVFNEHCRCDEEVLGRCGVKERNVEGRMVVNGCDEYILPEERGEVENYLY